MILSINGHLYKVSKKTVKRLHMKCQIAKVVQFFDEARLIK